MRRPLRSLSAPENTRITLATPSAAPSIRPSTSGLAPSPATRNTGSRLWTRFGAGAAYAAGAACAALALVLLGVLPGREAALAPR